MRTKAAAGLPLCFVPLLLAGCSPADARNLAVSNEAGLKKAVAEARAGDRITLAPGSYGPLAISGRRIEGAPVTLSGKGAQIASLAVEESSGWAFDGIEIGGAAGFRNRVITIQTSERIAIRNGYIHGLNVNNDPWDDETGGILLKKTADIELIGNRFRDLRGGVTASSSSKVRFEGNSIAYVREGSNWVAVKDSIIRCNRFSHMFPNLLRGEHPDAIQGWWNGDGNNGNLLIEGNVLSLGGPRAVQGIFLAGAWQPKEDPVLGRLAGLVIRDNVYYGSSRNAIALSGTVDAVIERNTLLPSPHAQQPVRPERSADGRRSSAIVPRLGVRGDVSTGLVSGNIAPGFSFPAAMEGGRNLTVETVSNGKTWKKTFRNPPMGDDPPDSSFFEVLPGSPAAVEGQGARPVCGDRLPPPIDAPSGWDPSMPPVGTG